MPVPVGKTIGKTGKGLMEESIWYTMVTPSVIQMDIKNSCKEHGKNNCFHTCCDTCGFVKVRGGYVLQNHLLLHSKAFHSFKTCNDISTIKDILEVSLPLYMSLFEIMLDRLHQRVIDVEHHFVNKGSKGGISLYPYFESSEIVIYYSQMGYKIYLKQGKQLDKSKLLQWLNTYPTVVGTEAVLDLTKMSYIPNVVSEVRKDMDLLRDPRYYNALAMCAVKSSQIHEQREALRYLRMSHFVIFGQKEMSQGILLAGRPGLGKTWDMKESIADAYWLPYDYKTKQYYDGYRGQSSIIVDDIGHHSNEEWKILLRLVNDAPFSLPVARCENKDRVFNVAKTIVATTNKMSNLMKMDVVTRDAICRRFDLYEYLEDGRIKHSRYNLRSHRYDAVAYITREFLRTKMHIETLCDVADSKYQGYEILEAVGIALPTKVTSIAWQLFGHLAVNVEPPKISVSNQGLKGHIGTVFDNYDWSQFDRTKKVQRQIRYLCHLKSITEEEFCRLYFDEIVRRAILSFDFETVDVEIVKTILGVQESEKKPVILSMEYTDNIPYFLEKMNGYKADLYTMFDQMNSEQPDSLRQRLKTRIRVMRESRNKF